MVVWYDFADSIELVRTDIVIIEMKATIIAKTKKTAGDFLRGIELISSGVGS